jgi:hypothetical protein
MRVVLAGWLAHGWLGSDAPLSSYIINMHPKIITHFQYIKVGKSILIRSSSYITKKSESQIYMPLDQQHLKMIHVQQST